MKAISLKQLRRNLRDLQKNIKKKKKVQQWKKDIKSFVTVAFSLQKNPAFICLGLTFLLLPGDNPYFQLQIKPQPPYLRNVSTKLPDPAPYPVQNVDIDVPELTAKSAIVMDVKSGVVMYEKNPNEPLLPASTTKIMTALVALKHYSLDKVITVKLADRSVGQTMDLVKGERITVEDLLYGLLLHSGNDAAYALAENFDGGYNAYIQEMNQLATKYHMYNTHFQNVSGIDQIGHFTTVSDLAKLAKVAMQNPIFEKIVSTQNQLITDVDQKITHPLRNINDLLGPVEGVRGIKTGWTEQAGECLVTSTIRDNKEIITVLLRSSDRFGESKSLIEWAYRAHDWVEPGPI